MFYTIYKITNILNGKFYVGKHQTKDLNDGYMGSGKVLKRAIAKHGIDNFQKEILYMCSSEQEMNDKEKELVTLHEMSYNLCPGGKGGFGYINGNGLTNTSLGRMNADKILFEKYGITNPSQLPHVKKLNSIKTSERIKNKQLPPPPNWTGKKHSEETKEKLREKAKGRIPWNKGKKYSKRKKK